MSLRSSPCFGGKSSVNFQTRCNLPFPAFLSSEFPSSHLRWVITYDRNYPPFLASVPSWCSSISFMEYLLFLCSWLVVRMLYFLWSVRAQVWNPRFVWSKSHPWVPVIKGNLVINSICSWISSHELPFYFPSIDIIRFDSFLWGMNNGKTLVQGIWMVLFFFSKQIPWL